MIDPTSNAACDMLKRWLRTRREARDRVARDASELMLWLGDGAYAEARQRARDCRKRYDSAGGRHWSRVAIEIAKRTGHVIGEKAADRFLADEPGRIDPKRRAKADELTTIAEAIRELAKGQADPTALHNAEAAVHRLVALAKGSSAESAGLALRHALAELSRFKDESAAALASGQYPPLADAAGTALLKLRTVVLPPA